MDYKNPKVAEVAQLLKNRLNDLDNKAEILRAVELRALFEELKVLPAEERAAFGKEVNDLQNELREMVAGSSDQQVALSPIDLTAPFDINVDKSKRSVFLRNDLGSIHPLMKELETILDIFYRMGFTAIESRQLDDDYHMFASLNFPEDHPARGDLDTFMTTEGLIAPAQTSTMQNRILRKYKANLSKNIPIAAVIPGRVFRNEDLDARHEHTFYQIEGVYVSKGINAGNLIATLKTFLQEYYGKDLEVKTQPYYFPFTEPSFEFALSCPFCEKKGCNICSMTGWIELLGCGMIHPNVLKEAGIDPNIYTGFAWGVGLDRLVMMKYDIEDVRYFESGRLDFLRQFP